MTESPVLILGCGYTGQRVARRLLARGTPVVATTPRPAELSSLAAGGARVIHLNVLNPDTLDCVRDVAGEGALVLHSVPVIRGERGRFDPTPKLLEALGNRPARIVYLSTTGVYGDTPRVDETTPVAPLGEQYRLRVAAERAVAAGGWSSLVLRPAAIYGPDRGVHVSIKAGRFRLVGDGGNLVSRIHVDDLAAIAEAALYSDVTGAWPVADEDPCTSREIARFCADLLGLPMPPSATATDVHPTRLVNRRVDAGAIVKLLGVKLQYPSYRVGVPAAVSLPQ